MTHDWVSGFYCSLIKNFPWQIKYILTGIGWWLFHYVDQGTLRTEYVSSHLDGQ